MEVGSPIVVRFWVMVLLQPLTVTVYATTADPALIPLTIPAALTDAKAGLALLQIPDAVAFDSMVVEPTHILVVPVILSMTGSGFTTTVLLDVVVQPLVVTV